ncbi:hypothetical protein ACFL06_00735 [Patescibacteria group bacterium]
MPKPLQIIIGIAVVLIAIYIFFSIFIPSNQPETCTCYEVVGDEDNFICYTPNGEPDTKGECVGDKIYKE